MITRPLRVAALVASTALTLGAWTATFGPARALAAPTHDPVLGAGKVQADINGDGYADLIMSGSRIDEFDDVDYGSFGVLYGSATGLTTTGRQRVDGLDLPGFNPRHRLFVPGAMVAGDFNGDGFSDVAVGDTGATVGSVGSAGAVYVIPGSANGLVVAKAKRWSQATKGVAGSVESGDRFGELSRRPTSAAVPRSTWPSACPVSTPEDSRTAAARCRSCTARAAG